MKLKNWLVGAGIFNIVVSILMFLVSRVTFVPVIFLVLSGFYYRTYFDKEDVYDKRGTLLILGIFNLIFNLISGIIVLEVYSLIKKDERYLISDNQKSNRINILLQLGVVLVLLSGIMIATNQTLVIPNIYKIIGLVLLSLIFFFLSYMSRKYLKLDSSFKTYFILALSFIVISFIGLYYYELLGSISLNHINDMYFYPLLFLLIGLCSGICAKVLKLDNIYYLTVYSVFASLFTWFNALGFELVSNLFVITLSVGLINFVYSPSCLATKIVVRASYYLSFILIIFNFVACLNNVFDVYSTILLLITTLNIFHLFIIKHNNLLSVVSVPTLLLNTSLVAFMSDDELKIEIVLFQVMLIVFYNLIKFIKLEDTNILFKRIYKILFNVSIISASFISLFVNSTSALIVTSLMMLQNIIGIIIREKEEIYLEPFKSILLIISVLISFNVNRQVDFIFNIFIIEIIELVLYLLMKNKYVKNIHYVLYIASIGIIAISYNDDLFLALMALVSSLIPLIISMFKKENDIALLIFTLIAMLLTNSNVVFHNIYYFNYLFVFMLMILYAYYFKTNKTKKYLTLFALSVLCVNFVDIMNFNYEITSSLFLVVLAYIGCLIASLLDNKDSKDIFVMIYAIIICLFNLFTSYILISLIIGVLTIGMFIYGVLKDFKKIKITGIILFVLNLIYMLKDFWLDIPLAIYLLVVGLILIGIVIIKEIKENK